MEETQMKRYGMVIRLKPGAAEEYKRLHAAVWPEVMGQIRSLKMRKYSIFLKEPENLLFPDRE
jgi:L-rhamnose mutarotase